ncbi:MULTISPECIES: Pls/PosA family non-ribosomal peptide synthetase [unclassified Blastococcus]|uniref:Pls/PosA family non-ribosomal peptide synthetase n=1 Tax=unclassified Blastococcus TaxID=2619396 RepID=UPI001EF0A976|nr:MULTISPECIES: Pls/PosA family non-ribosomal peptide synthetase [unclassified Blastococcus]
MTAGALAAAPVGAVPARGDLAATGVEAAFCGLLRDCLQGAEVTPESHFFDDLGADSMVMAQFCARVRKDPELPRVSIKDVYRHPTVRGLATALGGPVTPGATPPVVEQLGSVLADVLGRERVDPEAHFFDDLGADSMVMAQFCARVRKQPGLPTVSIKAVYQHPTLTGLASTLAPTPVAVEPEQARPAGPTAAPRSGTPGASAPPAVLAPARGRPRYVLCGVLQALTFLGYTYATTALALRGFEWVVDSEDLFAFYQRAVLVGAATFAGAALFPVAAKWILVGRWRAERFRVWSLPYLRFWVVKTLLRTSLVTRLYAGSPLYCLYLRALGARVGRGTLVLTRAIPVCTDLLTIGEGAVVRKDTFLSCYRVVDGVVETGPVTIGRHAYVGEGSVLDIGSSLGDGATLAHRSSLHEGQSVPSGQTWHGSPAAPTDSSYRSAAPRRSGSARRFAYGLGQLATTALLTMPLAVGVLDAAIADLPVLDVDLTPGTPGDAGFWLGCLLVSLVVFTGGALGSALFVVTVPRLLALPLRPGRVYPVYGLHYSLQRTIARTTNSKFLTGLFGDSSYIVGYLRAIGYRMTPVLQTGSNFGTGVRHETPYLVRIGTGTMAADGLSIVNADFSSTSFTLAPARIGAHSFLGNAITYPSGARVGDNCLLATKVLVPVHGPVRHDVGLLGSPAFEIPRSVDRDLALLPPEDQVPALLRRKNRYNLRTILLFLLARWSNLFLVLGATLVAAELYPRFGSVVFAASTVLALLLTTAWGVFLERLSTRFRPLRPRTVSIYDPYFWWHERFWKMHAHPEVFNGTPVKGLIWRLLGVRGARRLFDDGCGMPERSLVTLGDGCTLNAGATVQGHSQEDSAFKSGAITLGAGCTVGVGAWVHYGVTMGENSALAADAFLMKGEEVPAGAVWSGNPAVQVLDPPVAAAGDGAGRPAAAAPGASRGSPDLRGPAIVIPAEPTSRAAADGRPPATGPARHRAGAAAGGVAVAGLVPALTAASVGRGRHRASPGSPTRRSR